MGEPTQLELLPPKRINPQVQDLIKVLRGRDWTRAREIIRQTGWSDRQIRALANESRHRIVSYPGSPGYKLFEDCTVDEIHRAINAIGSQTREMTAKLKDLLRAYHSRS